MKLHGNARTCPNSRRLLVDRVSDQCWSVAAAAEAAGVSERTAYRWLSRWRNEGIEGLSDRSSAPRHIPHRTAPDRVQAIAALRRLHMTAAEIAEVLCMALSTVSAVLKPSLPMSCETLMIEELLTLEGENGARHDVGDGTQRSRRPGSGGSRRRPERRGRRARRAGGGAPPRGGWA